MTDFLDVVETATAVVAAANEAESQLLDGGFYINGVREDCIRWIVVDEASGEEVPKVLITRGCRSCPIESCDKRNLDQDGRTVIKHYKAFHSVEYGELLPSNYDKGPKLLSKRGGKVKKVVDSENDDSKSEREIINEVRRKRDKEKRLKIKDSPSDFAKRIRAYMDNRPQRVVKIVGEFLEWGPERSLEYIKTQWKEFCYRSHNMITPVEGEIIRNCLPFNLAILLSPTITPQTRIFGDDDFDTMIDEVTGVKELGWDSIYWPVNSLSAVLNGCLAWEYLTNPSANQIVLPYYHASEELKRFNFRTAKKFSMWKREYKPELEQIPGFKTIEDRIEESSYRFTEVDELIYDEIVLNMKLIADSFKFPFNKQILATFGYTILPSLSEHCLLQFNISEQQTLSILTQSAMIDPRSVVSWVSGKSETNCIAPPPQWWTEERQKKSTKKRTYTQLSSDDLESRIDTQLLND